MGGVSTPPVYTGSFGGNRWIGFPPKAPPTWGGGGLQGTVGGRLRLGSASDTMNSHVIVVIMRSYLLNSLNPGRSGNDLFQATHAFGTLCAHMGSTCGLASAAVEWVVSRRQSRAGREAGLSFFVLRTPGVVDTEIHPTTPSEIHLQRNLKEDRRPCLVRE